MNFIKAIQHATIGYGIRRKAWRERPDCFLHLRDDGDLEWDDPETIPCKLLGNDLAADLLPEDITATDWEAI